ncbi:MAG: ATP-binding protein [Bifidobacteriaceae bacterium]|nr:ATP-binding protein [Bifidobacteriaceae bacterium]
MGLVGRETERRELQRLYDSGRPELAVVYGRRRVGKTFLIDQTLGKDGFAFAASGAVGGSRRFQLQSFDRALERHGWPRPASRSWGDAFEALRGHLASGDRSRRQVVFLDEFPWFDTRGSDFRASFGLFWNEYASKDPSLMVIVCGSATSWIIKHLLKDRGALHNRATARMRIEPLTLGECEELFRDRGVVLNRYQQLESAMIFGGVPFYLDLFDPALGLAQNVDRLCFAGNGALRGEYGELYRSLFAHPERHMRVVEALAAKPSGLGRDELIGAAGLVTGGAASGTLEELEQCGFISYDADFTRPSNGGYYRLVDPFTLFHLRHMAPNPGADEHFWTNGLDAGARRAWAGLAFEQVCLAHVPQIKRRLGIAGVSTTATAWRSRRSSPAAQIDLVLDRRDGVVDLCELKYTQHPYTLTRQEHDALQRRREAFRTETGTAKALHWAMVTTYGLVRNAHASQVQSEVIMDDLFHPAG